MKEKLGAIIRFWKSRWGRIAVITSGIFMIILIVSLLFNISNSNQLATAKSETYSLESENGKIKEELETNKTELENVQQELQEVEEAFESYKEEMKPYEDMEEAEAENREHEAQLEKEEREKAEEEKKAQEEAERKKAEEEAAKQKEKEEKAEEEKKAQEEAERKKAEEEAAKQKEKEEKEKLEQGYETGISYEDLARNPDEFTGEKVKFSGKIIQVMDGDDYSQMRLAVNDDYNKVIYIEVAKDLMEDGRILEDDYITVMGVSFGLLDYESTLGGQITVPAIVVDDFELQ
ncbi:hypothetical protein [Salinicoccus carnicancri]|uniref:hypothetical protein n=1 Tax=Salinicoccus carnicancri TaxID=558170 RepID=UPI0002D9B5F0|nr:hypothetical protein [Salinicoccus carnicancri]